MPLWYYILMGAIGLIALVIGFIRNEKKRGKADDAAMMERLREAGLVKPLK